MSPELEREPSGPLERRKSYVPALGFHRLTALYDPMVRLWSAAGQIRSAVTEAMDLQPGMRILELGCGSGRLAIHIKRAHPEVEIEAVDIDRSMVARCRSNAAKAGVGIGFHEGDMTKGAKLGSFDRVYSTMVFHHLSPVDKENALKAARDALAPNGSFVVADFGKPRGALQWALFSLIQQPLDGFANTTPHRNGSYQAAVRATFATVEAGACWRTAAGTIDLLICRR